MSLMSASVVNSEGILGCRARLCLKNKIKLKSVGRRAGFSHYCHLSGICLPFLLLFHVFFFLVFTLKCYLFIVLHLFSVCIYLWVFMYHSGHGEVGGDSWDSTHMLVLKVKDRLFNLVASGLTCWAILPSLTIYLGFEIRCRYTSQAGIELVIPRLWSPNCCDYRCAPPCPAFLIIF